MPVDRVQVVPNGVRVERFSLGSGSTDGQINLISVGRLVKRKGFAWFVDKVMPLLPPHVCYSIIGSGPEEEVIKDAIQRHDLQDRVRLLGQCSDSQLVQMYQESDLLIMPNRPVPGDMEGFGVVILEAGACGTPTVAAKLEGITDVITPGENGVLVENGHAEAFCSSSDLFPAQYGNS